MNLKLDQRTGDLVGGNPPSSIGRSLTLSAFLASDLMRIAKKVRLNQDAYELWISLTDEFRLGAVLCFRQNSVLDHLNLKIVPKNLRDWSKRQEDEMKVRHDKWLTTQLGVPPHDFAWGRVISVIDGHDYSAVIRVIYRA